MAFASAVCWILSVDPAVQKMLMGHYILATFIKLSLPLSSAFVTSLEALGPAGLPVLPLSACLLLVRLFTNRSHRRTRPQTTQSTRQTDYYLPAILVQRWCRYRLVFVLYRLTYRLKALCSPHLTLFVQQACGGLIAGYFLAKLYKC